MLKKIIIIENNNQIQCNTLEDVVKILIDKNYYNMTTTQRMEKMKKKALANCINTKIKIVENIEPDALENLNDIFIIKDEFTYILSLLIANKIMLLERKDSNVFSSYLNKTNFKDNYIIINIFAKELLKKYIENIRN